MSDGFIRVPEPLEGARVDNQVFERLGKPIYRQRVESHFGDSPAFDAFQHLRVSESFNQFAAFNEYRINPFNWVQHTVGTGSLVFNTTTKTTLLSTGGTASGARAVLQSRAYLRYSPGESLFPIMTFTFGTPQTDAVQRVGYFDD
jgi:hypothetical protein